MRYQREQLKDATPEPRKILTWHAKERLLQRGIKMEQVFRNDPRIKLVEEKDEYTGKITVITAFKKKAPRPTPRLLPRDFKQPQTRSTTTFARKHSNEIDINLISSQDSYWENEDVNQYNNLSYNNQGWELSSSCYRSGW